MHTTHHKEFVSRTAKRNELVEQEHYYATVPVGTICDPLVTITLKEFHNVHGVKTLRTHQDL